jgi:hypothetical protein
VCSSLSFGCVSLDVLLAGASHFTTCERLPQGDAIWPLARAACRIRWRWGVLALGP